MAFGDTGILDDFNRANEGPPMTGWLDLVSGLVVVSNACGPSGPGIRSSYYNTILTDADCEVFCTIASDPASNRSQYVYARLVDIGTGTTDGYALKFNKLAGTDTLQILRIDDGGETVLGADFSQELVAGNKFGLELVGDTLTAYVDTGSGWTSLGSRTDATHAAAGYLGAAVTSGTIDDFGGGELAAGGTDALTANDLATGTPTLTAAAIGQVHGLSADDLTTASPTLTSASLGQVHALTPDDLTVGTPDLDSPTLGQVHSLTGNDLATGAPLLDSPTLGTEGTDALTADDLATGQPVLSSPALGQIHALVPDYITTGTPLLDTAVLGQVHALSGSDLTAGTPTLSQPGLDAFSFIVDTFGTVASAGRIGAITRAEQIGTISRAAQTGTVIGE